VMLTLALAVIVTQLRPSRYHVIASVALAAVLVSTLLVAVRFDKEFAVHRPYEVIKAYYNDAPEYVPKYAE
ncbi:MAG TPA: hypothetical protein VFH43_05470, partial [Candidatus Kapabacteria bacterium]|nr:hypothetical protein [Candidatus Kapabacteria bacterium]